MNVFIAIALGVYRISERIKYGKKQKHHHDIKGRGSSRDHPKQNLFDPRTQSNV